MSFKLNVRRKSDEEMLSPSKYLCLEEPICEESSNIYTNELNLQNFAFTEGVDTSANFYYTPSFINSSNNELPVSEIPLITKTSSAYSIDTPNDISHLSQYSSDLVSTKEYLNTFFGDLCLFNDSSQGNNLLSSEEQVQEEQILQSSVDLHNSPIMSDSSTANPNIKSGKSCKSIIFNEELSNYIHLILKLSNNKYYVEIKQNSPNSEDVPTKKGIIMNINSWYEFQYKIFAFNLKYKSSSFVANNTILVLNFNNSIARLKNLKNYSHIELCDYQLEKLKELTCDLNKSLLHHMYTNQLPRLIKRKCTLVKIPLNDELTLMSKLLSAIEENMLSLLNRVFECSGCIFNQKSQSLHVCFMFNNREKFQQLGDMLLMLINLDFVVSMFSNSVNTISDNFLNNINVECIQNALFKSMK